jgi:hypothetical protein
MVENGGIRALVGRLLQSSCDLGAEREQREQDVPCSLNRGTFTSLLGPRTLAVNQHHYCSLINRAPDRPKRSC